ncbi:hypothetical protein ACNPM8_01580 [Glutamicibacter sp. AGC46]
MDSFWNWLGANWISLLAAIGAVLSGIFTWRANSKAKEANTKADTANDLAKEANSIAFDSHAIAKAASEFVSFDCRPVGDGRTFRIRNTGNVRVSVYSILFDNGRPRWEEYTTSSPLDPGQSIVEQIKPIEPGHDWIVTDKQEIAITYYHGEFAPGNEKIWTGIVQSTDA